MPAQSLRCRSCAAAYALEVATAAFRPTIYAVQGAYDDCSRLTVELSFELPWAFVNVGLRSYYAEGSKTVAFENMAILAAHAGVFGETAAGVSLGVLREAVARVDLGANDRVVLLVTGDGLKTPGPVSSLLDPVRIDADADAVLERLGVLT